MFPDFRYVWRAFGGSWDIISHAKAALAIGVGDMAKKLAGANAKAQTAELAERVASAERRAAHSRAALAHTKEAAKEALTAAKKKGAEMAKTAFETAAQQPIVDAAAEMAGTVAEAAIHKKKPEYENYVVAFSFLGEVVCSVVAMQPKTTRDERDGLRAGASASRGLRARWNVKMADKLVASVMT
jgi:cell division septum initiation protein DivIVA